MHTKNMNAIEPIKDKQQKMRNKRYLSQIYLCKLISYWVNFSRFCWIGLLASDRKALYIIILWSVWKTNENCLFYHDFLFD